MPGPDLALTTAELDEAWTDASLADAKSLHALDEYGRLHGAVRLRWGFLDERLPVPWVDRDE